MGFNKGKDIRRVRRKRNEIARDLRTPKYRKRIIKSKKVYTRKGEIDGLSKNDGYEHST